MTTFPLRGESPSPRRESAGGSLADVIRSKEAAGRAKDIAVLPDLIDYLRRRQQ